MSTTQKILWGPTTWTFFHVLAEKINEEFFLKNKNEVLQIIVTISNNLPCPLCSEHARSITSKKNLRIIKNKEDLIRFLNYFHNNVNMRNGKQLFHMKDMDKYKNINFQIAIHNFLTFYTKSYNISSFRLSLDSSQTNRKRIAKNVITWLNKYWRYLN
jgi:hypothetical protein